MPATTNLGNFLRSKRQKKGFTQKTLAKKLSIQPPIVSNWERGVYAPSAKTIQNLIGLLSLDKRSLAEAMEKDAEADNMQKIYQDRRLKPFSTRRSAILRLRKS